MEEEKKEENTNEEQTVEVPEKFKEIVEKIESMSVLDLSELVKILEKKFGVSAQAVTAAAVAPAAEAGDAGTESEEKTIFDVELTSVGDQKIQVIKAVKEITGLGLKDAKDLVDSVPSKIKEGLKKEEAEELKTKIEAAGGKVELK